MTDSIDHLPGIKSNYQPTRRLQVHALTRGPTRGEPVLFLHGNLTTSTFWEEAMLALPDRYRAVAVDLRGYGLSDSTALIDATRGFADWADDALALADALGWDRFHLAGHSLGGCAAWALVAREPQRIRSVTLVAPGPPCGFGGAHGLRGELNYADGAGSGAGLVNSTLVELLAQGERDQPDNLFSPRGAMTRLYWKPPFHPAREEAFITAMLQVHQGEDRFPGDWCTSPNWPGFAPGSLGPINAISPFYNQWVLEQLVDAPRKPRLLWVYGADDAIVCDNSPSDAGTQGKLGFRTGWPGDEAFPPQPLLAQVSYALEQYERDDASVRRLVIEGVGHSPHLERPDMFHPALIEHLRGD